MADAFDTLAASEELQTGGLDENQSKAVARVINGAVTGNVATKDDLEKLRLQIRNHFYLTQGALFIALIAVLKDWSQIFN